MGLVLVVLQRGIVLPLVVLILAVPLVPWALAAVGRVLVAIMPREKQQQEEEEVDEGKQLQGQVQQVEERVTLFGTMPWGRMQQQQRGKSGKHQHQQQGQQQADRQQPGTL